MLFLGSGVPGSYIASRQNFPLPVGALPDAQTAVTLYRNSGGNLTDETNVGEDLLQNYPHLQADRDQIVMTQILQTVGSPENLFGFVSNHSYWQLQRAISIHIFNSERIFSMI